MASNMFGYCSAHVQLSPILSHRKPEEVKYFIGDESTDPNNNITMTNEDLLQPGHVVKERWRVVSVCKHCECYKSKFCVKPQLSLHR